jgi:hypothetical protein
MLASLYTKIDLKNLSVTKLTKIIGTKSQVAIRYDDTGKEYVKSDMQCNIGNENVNHSLVASHSL